MGKGGVQCYGRASLTFRALLTLLALRPSLALWASGSGSACGALRALLTLRADRADGALRALLAFEVTSGNAVLEGLQTASGFLSALAGLKKLPKTKDLSIEYAELLKKKKEAYPDYRKARDEMQELMKAQKNVEMFFAEEKDTAEKEPTR